MISAGGTVMVVKIRVKYDGKVFVPQEPVELTRDGDYVVAFENGTAPPPPDDVPEIPADVPYPLMEIHKLATDMGVTDLSERHKHYAHPGPEGE
jgi:hypothetical protein